MEMQLYSGEIKSIVDFSIPEINNTHFLENCEEGFNGIEEYCFYALKNVNEKQIRVKFDSAASRCMSGVSGRIRESVNPMENKVLVTGFNGQHSSVDSVGVNNDGKKEYFISSMPRDLALLCAHEYAQDGAAILFKNDGLVISLNDAEVIELRDYLKDYPVIKKLIVRNRTYEVENRDNIAFTVRDMTEEEAFSNTAARFFNTKVNISNATERVLTMLMTGFSFADLYSHVKNSSLSGMPPDLTLKVLNNFEHKFGRTPDIIRLATPIDIANSKGLMENLNDITFVGQRIEIDIMESDYNFEIKEGRTKKLPSHGGAIACAVCVDCFSGYVHGKLLKSTANTKIFIEEFIELYELENVLIKLLASDSGIVSQTMFQVWTPDAEKMLLKKKIKSERAEPYNHQRGTPTIERTIRMIKELMRIAMMCIFRNPNFETLGFPKVQVLKLWGELFNWSISVINLKPCPHDKKRSRYEVFKKEKPNMQSIRILPIFSVILVLKNTPSKGNQSNQLEHQIGLYVGPSMKTGGAIRAAVFSGGSVRIVVTSKFTAATDGGGLNVFPHIQNGLHSMLQETDKKTVSASENEAIDPEEEEKSQIRGDINVIDDKITSIDESEELLPPDSVVSPSISVENVNLEIFSEVHSDISTVNTTVTSLNSKLVDEHDVENMTRTKKKRSKNKKDKSINASLINIGKKKVRFQDDISKSDDYLKFYPTSPDLRPTREARLQNRAERKKEQSNIAVTSEELETACLADWSTYEDSAMFWSWCDTNFIEVQEFNPNITCNEIEEGYRAVTDNVPKTYAQALVHPKWGAPARKEWDTLTSTKAIVEVDMNMAIDAIRSHGADLVLLFPVYEEKIKDGEIVYKVRLVGDGRTHHSAGNTYSATPSREEFLIVLHVIASLGWVYAHVDEIRAFLNAGYKGKNKVFTKFRGENKYYEVLGALYGLKTSPKDYQDTVADRLLSLGYTRLHMCGCIYLCVSGKEIVIIFDYVDDFVFAGSSRAVVQAKIDEMREITSTTEPIWDAGIILGMEISRNYEKKVISVKMQKKIEELCNKFDICKLKKKETPMPTSGYIVKEHEFDDLGGENSLFLSKDGIAQYMAIVGSLIWISGVRLDILFAVMYLSWSTKNPRKHHMKMAIYCLSYLFYTKDLPLVLGGNSELQITGYTDASLGTGPKGRSILGQMIKLNENSGAISAKAHATQCVFTSSFEAELDGVASAMKSISRVSNILNELRLKFSEVHHLWSDNVAMIEFVQGKGVAKGVRHMELRMWYVREKYMQGNVALDYMEGTVIPADKLTKLGNSDSHKKFTENILGLRLLR